MKNNIYESTSFLLTSYRILQEVDVVTYTKTNLTTSNAMSNIQSSKTTIDVAEEADQSSRKKQASFKPLKLLEAYIEMYTMLRLNTHMLTPTNACVQILLPA